MREGSIPPKRPPGFGSSSARFPDSKKDKTPGPGTYNPKKLGKGPSYTFGKAARFHEAQMRRDVRFVDNLNGQKSEDKASPEEYQWKKQDLNDGRTDVILGDLDRDITNYQKDFQKTISGLNGPPLSVSDQKKLDALQQRQSHFLKEVNDELEIIMVNRDLETDEFGTHEIRVIGDLQAILQQQQDQLGRFQSQDKLHRQNLSSVQLSQDWLGRLEGRYSDSSDISVNFDGTAESLERMTKALSSTDKVEIFDGKFEKVQHTMTKAKFLQNKQFYIKRPPPETPFLPEFKALFPESNPNCTL